MSRPLDIADVVVRDRLRPLDQAHVELLADSMRRQKEAGLRPQISPIEVARSGDKFLLVSGAHRLAAAKQIGLSKIDAEITEGNVDQRRFREVEENVCRHDLNALDWSFFILEWFRLQGGLIPPKNKEPTDQNIANQCWEKISQRGFSEAVAGRVNLTSRSIRNALKIANELEPVRKHLEGLPIASNQSELLRLADKKTRKKRPAIIEKLKAGKSYAEATAAKATASVGKDGALTTAWNKASVAEQDSFLRTALTNLTTSRRRAFGQWMVDNGIVPTVKA